MEDRDLLNKLFEELTSRERLLLKLYIPENVLSDLSKRKIYGMGMKEDTMDILNPDL